MNSSDIESTILLWNNTLLEDFSGLTPNEMNYLLHDTFGDKSPMQFRKEITNETLDRIPFFRVAEEFLKLVQRDKQIKLTPLGYLPRKVLVELYAHKILPEYFIERGVTKLWREEDCIAISSVRLTTGLAGLVKKSVGKLSLTKKGTTLLQPENRLQLFKTIFTAFTNDFSWSYNDGYPEYPIGQLGFGFSLYLLNQFGEQEQTANFYADKYVQAFPKFLTLFPDNQYSKSIDNFRHCYELRTINNFFEWFGLATVERSNNFFERDKTKLKRTELFNQLFIFE
ncbi:MAG: hypothetical protein RJA07_938 [Bacteroidota bacterium]|jgi:hypothetical protein